MIGSELFVADPDNNRVQVLGFDGIFHRDLAMPSPGRPLDLATDGTNLYVACDSGRWVLVLDPLTGANLYPPMTDGVYYRGIAVDPITKTIFAISDVDARIHWFRLVAGSYVAQAPFGSPPFGGAGGIPTGMVKNGPDLYVANTSLNAIVRFTGDDTSGYAYMGQVTGTSGPTSVTSPYEFKMDAAGRFYVPSYNQGKFTVFNPDWSLNTTCSAGGYGTAYGIAVDPGGDVYLSSDFAPQQAARVEMCLFGSTPTPTPTATPIFVPSCSEALAVPMNLYSPAAGPLALSITLCRQGRYVLTVYNTAGEHIRTLRDVADQPAGVDPVEWDGTNEQDEPVASGVYLLRLVHEIGVITAKVAVVR